MSERRAAAIKRLSRTLKSHRVNRQQRRVRLAPVLLQVVGQVLACLVQLVLVDYQVEHVLDAAHSQTLQARSNCFLPCTSIPRDTLPDRAVAFRSAVCDVIIGLLKNPHFFVEHPTCDGRKDGQTNDDSIFRVSMASHG